MDSPVVGKAIDDNFSGSILVVEDEEMLGELLIQLLEDEGYSVFYAKDGLAALEICKKHNNSISLVISDVGLPEMNGIELFEKLKILNPQIKVIMASGFFEPELKARITQRGVDATVKKPYRGGEVLSTIRYVLHS